MLMKYDSVEQTTEQIKADSTIPDMYDQNDFVGVYNCYSTNHLNDFNYKKDNFVKQH